jgi:hypothetical protein
MQDDFKGCQVFNVQLDKSDAEKGSTITIPINGKNTNIRLPPNLQPDTRIRLKDAARRPNSPPSPQDHVYLFIFIRDEISESPLGAIQTIFERSAAAAPPQHEPPEHSRHKEPPPEC